MPAIALKLPVDTTDPAFASATVNAPPPVLVEPPLKESRVLIVGSMPVRMFRNGCDFVTTCRYDSPLNGVHSSQLVVMEPSLRGNRALIVGCMILRIYAEGAIFYLLFAVGH